jgi:enoyl-CoA hydratase/carnithine racemase
MKTYRDIEFEIEDPVALLRLNRPEKLNSFTYDTLAEIRDAVDTAVADTSVVSIVVTGKGRGFSAGLDSSTLAGITAEGGRQGRRDAEPDPDELPGLFSYFFAVPKPIIAAVNGVAAGGGLMLAGASDIRFASTAASFTTSFSRLGLVAEHGSSWVLPRLLGSGRALDLLWSSRRIDASEAYRIGLVDYLCEPEELLHSARAYIQKLATTSSPRAMADTKRLVYRHLGMGYAEAYREADEATWQAVARPDANEGARALLEKREPCFERLARKRARAREASRAR